MSLHRGGPITWLRARFALGAVCVALSAGCVDVDALRDRAACTPGEACVPARAGSAGIIGVGGSGGSSSASTGSGGSGGSAATTDAGSAGTSAGSGTGGSDSPDAGGTGADAGSSTACTPDACTGMPRHICDPASGRCVCDDRCESAEATSCVQGKVSVCRAGPEGCLDWMPLLDCPMGCGDERSCAGCNNACSTPGSGECVGNQVRLCAADAQGCLVFQPPSDCADQTPCTTDRCNAALGRCEYVPDDTQCRAHAGNPCVRDYCDAKLGCNSENVAASCNDGQVCTIDDACQSGVCSGALDAQRAGCVDLCPDDPNKTAPGVCGCGVVEDTGDLDGDNELNCMDSCPRDACQTVGVTCMAGTRSDCRMDGQGCMVRTETPCAAEFCFDATHCGNVVVRGWATGERASPGAIAIDAQGNTYVGGYAQSSIDGNTYGGGDADMFLTKWSATGTRLWTSQWGGADWEFASDIALNAAGDRVAATGRIGNALWVGVWSTNARGAPLWTIQIATQVIVPKGIVFGPGGDLYVAGDNYGPLPNTSNAGDQDSFLLRLSASNGATVWARQWGTSRVDGAQDVATDGTNLYVAGWRDAIAGPDTTAGDGYLAKYNASGTQLWERIFNSGQRDEARGVGVDNGGNVYVCGMSWGTSGVGLHAKVNAANGLQWENGATDAEALAVDSNGNSYAAIAATVQAVNASGLALWRKNVSPGVTGDVAARALPSGALRVITVGSEGPNYDQGYFAIITAE